jgi:hypothetical protein
MSRVIEKKVLAKYFALIESGQKTFELRLADWDCQPGDILVLQEIDDKAKQPTGRTLRRTVGAVARTKDIDFWSDKEIVEHGYQVISLLAGN